MEILGDTAGGAQPEGPDRPVPFEVDLDAELDRAPDPDPAPSRRRAAAFGALVAPEALGLAGVLVQGMNLTTSGLQIVFLLRNDPNQIQSNRDQLMIYVAGMVAVALAGGLLSVAGLLRLTQRSGTFAKAVTGAGTLLGVIFLIVAAVMYWQGSSMPDTP